jgi:hypothetical protein
MADHVDTEVTGDDARLHLNGIDALTGLLAVPPMTEAEAAQRAAGGPPPAEDVGILRRLWEALKRPFHGLPDDVEATDLTASGWAVVLPTETPDEVRQAIERLVAHRRDHTRVPANRCRIVAYRPGQSLGDWLRGLGAHLADVEPTRLPYYVSLVGGPELISFEFQTLLDMNYAVGRIAFDRPEQYRRYVEGLIAYETAAALPNGREVLYWGPRNRADRATQLSADYLIRPLFEGIAAAVDQPALPAIAEQRQFRSRCLGGPDATRANLLEPLHATEPVRRPAFLFTASHGLEWPNGHENQLAQQGALLCQDWPGPGVSPRSEHYVRAADIGDEARLQGLVAFLFACHGAGTPTFDQFLADRAKGPVPIAGQPFVAALPQRLLSHPNGPALAVFGHVERAWGYSIRPRALGPRLRPFRNLISRILKGEPVGHATKDLSDRFTAASAQLNLFSDPSYPGARPPASELAALWVECNDARNYVLLGDPAARLRIDLLG